MKKILIFSFIFFIISIIIEIGYFSFLHSKRRRTPIPIIVGQQIIYTPTPPNPTSKINQLVDNIQILSQKEDDQEGRTIIYQDDKKRYSGAGEFPDKIIGSFQAWELIENSSDRYLIIKNPISQEMLPKTRISFGTRPFCNDIDNTTSLAVENILKNEVNELNKTMGNLSAEEFTQLIKKDDVLIAIPLVKDIDGITNIIYDGKGNICSSWIILRRN